MKPQTEATASEAGRILPMVLEQPQIGEGMKQGIEVLVGSLAGTLPA
jgi:hypothetical protein